MLKGYGVYSEGESVRFIVHWQGGDHTELSLKKTPVGRHRHITSTETIELITSLARQQPDERIAATINRLGVGLPLIIKSMGYEYADSVSRRISSGMGGGGPTS